MDPGRILFDQLAGDAVKELLRAVTGTFLCRSTAERLRRTVEPLLPLVQQGGRHALRSHAELGELAAQLREALDLARRAAASPRWNVYRAAQLARRMEAADQGIARWLARHATVNVLHGVRRLRDEADARIGRLERRVEEVSAAMQPPPAGIPPAMSLPVALPPSKGMAMAVEVAPPAKGMGMPMDLELPEEEFDKGAGVLGSGIKVGKERVKEMVMSGGGGSGWEVVSICGMGGSGKTTLAMEIYKDQKVQDVVVAGRHSGERWWRRRSACSVSSAGAIVLAFSVFLYIWSRSNGRGEDGTATSTTRPTATPAVVLA